MIFLPVRLFIRLKNPCRRFCTSRVCRFIVFRGPHRIWLAPARAGCAEIAVRGTKSAVVVVASPADAVAIVEGVKDVVLGRKATFGRETSDGRRGISVVNVLGSDVALARVASVRYDPDARCA
jgi:hypothetical protein